MAAREELALTLSLSGDYRRLLEEFRDQLRSPSAMPSGTRFLLAHALAMTGDLPGARRLVGIRRERESSQDRAQVEFILGLTSERGGQIDEALRHYETGRALLNQQDHASQLAWLELHRFRLLAEGHPMKALTAMLPSLRRLVYRAGEPQLVAYLHMCIAVLEGKTGGFDEARRHCSVAESLLAVSDNISLRGSNLVNEGCLAVFTCNLESARRAFSEAMALVPRSGDNSTALAVLINLGHLSLLSGDTESAKSLFRRALEDSSDGKLVKVGVLDGLARTYIVEGAFDEAERALGGVASRHASQAAFVAPYLVRWAWLTNARLLFRRRELAAASHLLGRLQTETTRAVQDIPFNASVALLTALVASRLQAHVTAASELFAACQLGAHGMRELQPQLYHVASAVVDEDDRYLSQALQQRADRLWDAQGIVSTRVELDDHGTNLDGARRALASARTRPPHPPRTIQTMTSAIAAALDLAHTPRLCGLELLSIIHALGCSPDARLLESTDPIHADDRYATLALGSDAGATVTLVCRLPDRPAQALLLADVLRLGSAALMLDVAKREARNHAALWPASPAEEQAGALFVAEEMQALLALVRRIAPTNVPVLITGETGTGKEVLARTVHAYSGRARKPFVPFNCSATPREMLDAQLFGHRKGAFTGATEHFPGVIRAANGGTLFLDEIGETTLDLQPKLLRFLEAGEVHPIGDTQPTHVDVRIIAATNADLDELVAQARFRDDLFYRLNIVRLHVPPLRSRREEIPLLAQHYLDKYSQEAGKHGLRLAEETVEYLVLYRWPGNVRQLANEMRRLCALADTGAVLMPEHLSAPIAASRRTVPPSQRTLEATEVVVRLDQPLAAATAHLERALIQYALQQCHGAMEATAGALGLSRKGLYLKRQRLGIEVAPLS